MSSDRSDTVQASLRRSGFPLQTAIAHTVQFKTEWKVEALEYPWLDNDGKEQFLDLVATADAIRATIECKKTEKETLTFLPDGPDEDGGRRTR